MEATTLVRAQTRLEELKIRAKKARLKIDYVRAYDWHQSHRAYFGIGSNRIKDFQNHCDQFDGDDCKVWCFDSLDEVDAFLHGKGV